MVFKLSRAFKKRINYSFAFVYVMTMEATL